MDLIERQAAIDLINDIDLINFTAKGVIRGRLQKLPSAQPEIKCIAKVTLTDEQVKEAFEKAKSEIVQVFPSAQPERKTAHWVPLDERFASWSSYYKCSECGFRINLRTVTDFSGQSVNYCPHCGLRMEVEHEA